MDRPIFADPINSNPDSGKISRLSWRPLFSPLAAYRPQQRQQSIEPGPLRRQLNTHSTWRFNALMTSMRDMMVGPIEIDDQEQGFYHGLPHIEILFGLRQTGDVVVGIAQSHKLTPTR